MTPKFSPSRTPADMRRALDCIVGCVCAFDRLKIYIDDDEPLLALHAVPRKYRSNIKARINDNAYQRIWKTTLELYQPNDDMLHIVSNMLGTRNMSKVSYAEIAIDWLTQDRKDAAHLGGYLLEHVLIPYTRSTVRFVKKTAYFNSRHSAGNSSGTTTFYTDRLSKLLAGKYAKSCCHMERRLRGRAACSQIGLNSIHDCIHFDHVKFWRNALRLYDFRSKADIGVVLAPNPNVSRTALRQRGNLFLEAYEAGGCYAGRHVLQNCVRDKPALQSILEPLDNRFFLKKLRLS